jgi:GrpB-like predicted nucleotidyltransferase (UPF0157 family)
MTTGEQHGLGLRSGEVRLVPHDAAWAAAFAAERDRLRAALGRHAVAIEHIGSTAVPDLPAKPVIDIAVAVRSLLALPELIRAMEAAGYTHKGEHGLPGRQFFVRGEPATHHVHLVEPDSPLWADWIALRDDLRAHPADRAAYAAFKLGLAARHAQDRDAYTKAKDPFVQQLREKRGRMR